MVMRPNGTSLYLLIAFVAVFLIPVLAGGQNAPSEQVQVGPGKAG